VIHYHGGPVTPETCAIRAWRGGHACISFANPDQIELAAAICQSFFVDNGAFTFWKQGRPVDWPAYYGWCDRWLAHPGCDFAVIPDVIDGSEAENDALIGEWPFGHRGVPVWHLNESPGRLVRLAAEWPRVALGSTQEWDVSVPSKCLERLYGVLPAICNDYGQPLTRLHGLRMLNPAIVTAVPLASADSTNLAQNIGIDKRWDASAYAPATKEGRAMVLRERIESRQSPDRLNEVLAAQHRAMHGQGVLWDGDEAA
jgi:hypothetical protein